MTQITVTAEDVNKQADSVLKVSSFMLTPLLFCLWLDPISKATLYCLPAGIIGVLGIVAYFKMTNRVINTVNDAAFKA